MKVNLIEQLEKNVLETERKAFKNNSFIKEDILNQANTLLLNAHNEETQTLEILGVKHLSYERELTSNVVRSKKIKEIYNKSVYTGRDLKLFCNLYWLKVLPVEEYTGAIPTEFAKVINNFCKERNITISQAKDNLFILAPVEMFNTIDHIPEPNLDPILLYRDDERHTSSYNRTNAREEDFFIQIYNWGNDFGVLRRFKYLFTSTIRREDDIRSIIATIISTILFVLSFIVGWFSFSITFPLIIFLIGGVVLFVNSTLEKHVDTLWNSKSI